MAYTPPLPLHDCVTYGSVLQGTGSSVMSTDRTCLIIDHLTFAKMQPSLADWYNVGDNARLGNLLDNLNEHYAIFDSVHHLRLESDALDKVPPVVQMRFKKLKTLVIAGSQWSNLRMADMPRTLTRLDIVQQSTADLNGMAKQLQALERLTLSTAFFGSTFEQQLCGDNKDSAEQPHPLNFISRAINAFKQHCFGGNSHIPNLPRLTKIRTQLDFYIHRYDLPLHWVACIRDQPLLDKVRNRIQKITCGADPARTVLHFTIYLRSGVNIVGSRSSIA